jgi:predicted aminopeptidase
MKMIKMLKKLLNGMSGKRMMTQGATGNIKATTARPIIDEAMKETINRLKEHLKSASGMVEYHGERLEIYKIEEQALIETINQLEKPK